jgi:hypothetical protein
MATFEDFGSCRTAVLLLQHVIIVLWLLCVTQVVWKVQVVTTQAAHLTSSMMPIKTTDASQRHLLKAANLTYTPKGKCAACHIM